MRKNAVTLVAVVAAVLLVAGGLYASNMGFKLNYRLDAQGSNGSASGTNSLALPYNQQTGLNDAKNLIDDINAQVPGAVISVSKFIRSSDSSLTYTGAAGTAFALVPGEGYRVQVANSVDYIVVGSHNPSLVINLDAQGDNGSASGTNDYSYPYHSVSDDANDLISEINAAAGSSAVISVSKFLKTSDSSLTYTGAAGTAFALVPGESYRIQVSQSVSFVPNHY